MHYYYFGSFLHSLSFPGFLTFFETAVASREPGYLHNLHKHVCKSPTPMYRSTKKSTLTGLALVILVLVLDRKSMEKGKYWLFSTKCMVAAAVEKRPVAPHGPRSAQAPVQKRLSTKRRA